jgi:hypothetical protein
MVMETNEPDRRSPGRSVSDAHGGQPTALHPAATSSPRTGRQPASAVWSVHDVDEDASGCDQQVSDVVGRSSAGGGDEVLGGSHSGRADSATFGDAHQGNLPLDLPLGWKVEDGAVEIQLGVLRGLPGLAAGRRPPPGGPPRRPGRYSTGDLSDSGQPEDEPPGFGGPARLACRLYPGADGGDHCPTVQQIQKVLADAA